MHRSVIGIKSSRSRIRPLVAVATLNGKAYYTITDLLRRLDLPFISSTPEEKTEPGVKLVITTRSEKTRIDFDKILCIEEIDGDDYLTKEKIIWELYGNQKDTLFIGVDPGLRIGVTAFYRQQAVEEEVMNSMQEAIERIVSLVEHSPAEKRIVRIGDGKRDMAESLAAIISTELMNTAQVELVDERGTSSLSKTRPNRRGLRDLRSARLIALRQGRRFLV
jgi:hypothetical protein